SSTPGQARPPRPPRLPRRRPSRARAPSPPASPTAVGSWARPRSATGAARSPARPPPRRPAAPRRWPPASPPPPARRRPRPPRPAGGGTTPPTAPAVHPTNNPPAKGPANLTLTDKTGDTVTDGTGVAMAQPQADIVKAQANWSAKALVLAVQVAQPVNPGQDPHWASQSTYIDWSLDTNGDGAADYEVQY